MKLNIPTLGILALSILVLSGCNGDDKKKPKATPTATATPTMTPTVTPTPVALSPLAEFKGAWIQEGTGLVLNIGEADLTVYRYTSETCSIISDFNQVPLVDADDVILKTRSSDNGSTFSFVLLGDSEFDRFHLVSETLPNSCVNAPDPEQFNPEFIFEHAWHSFNDYYPFFTERNVDWQAQRNRFRNQVSSNTTERELFEILKAMISPINDGHVSLSVETDSFEEQFFPAKSTGWNARISALAKQEDVSVDEARVFIFLEYIQKLATNYGDGEFKFSGENELSLVWGKLVGNVGYLNIVESEIDPEEGVVLTTEQQLDKIAEQMEAILEEFKDTDSLIVDVSFNPGGSDVYSLAIASYFTDTERLAFSKEDYNNGNPTPRKEFFVKPNSHAYYGKPVTLITTSNSASAAEIFTIAMQAIPTVSHVGEPTNGILSDILGIELMEGWDLGISSQVYYSPDNEVFEVVGVPPETHIPVTSLIGVSLFGALPAVHHALAENGVDVEISQDEFEAEMRDLMTDSRIPGLSVAWINPDGVIGQFASGFADIENAIPVNGDTPFNLGSVSKTFIGTAGMQMIERDILTETTTLADVQIPFSVDSPHVDASAITFKHLANHTSGIAEQLFQYNCGYHIIENGESLYALEFDEFEACPDSLGSDQGAFLERFLSTGGALYTEDHFLAAEPGESYAYSNIGATLAAQMLATAADTEFNIWTEENIFNTLNMNNTHWFNSDFQGDVVPAKRYIFVDNEVFALPEFALSTWADGGLKSSAPDLAKYLLAIVRKGELNGERILSEASVDRMLSAGIEEPTIEGKRIFWDNDEFLIGHNGGDPGTESAMYYDQYNKVGWVMMLNLGDEIDDLDEDDLEIFTARKDRLNHLIYRRGLTLNKEVNR